MKKIRAAAYVFYKSMTSPKYYSDVVKTNFAFSMKYFAVLAVLATIVSIPTTAVPLAKDVNKGIDSFLKTVPDAYPSDLVITVKDGELSINQPEPYIIPYPEEMEIEGAEMPANIIVFDSNGTLDDLEKFDTFFLVNKSNVLAKGTNKVEVYPLKDYPDGELTHQDIEELVAATAPFVEIAPYIAAAMAILATLLYYFGFRMAYLLIVAVFLLVAGAIRGLKMPFGKYYQIGIHAITLPLIIETAAGVANVPINIKFWFIILNVTIGILGILAISKKDTANIKRNPVK